jgi:hypothetical protein
VKSYREGEVSSGTVWAVGSLTSYPFKNPGLRMWHLDPESFHIVDYEQWRIYLPEANEAYNLAKIEGNETKMQESGEWGIAYVFKERYGLEDMRFDTLNQLIVDMRTNKTLSDLLLSAMHGEG